MRIVAITARTIRWAIAGHGAARGRSERAAVLLEARSDRGAIGLGEAAPLPGMSLDTIEQAETALATFAGLVPFDLVMRDPAHAGARAERHMGNATESPRRLLPFEIVNRDAAQLLDTAPPAARFAIETALCDALARDRGLSLGALLVAHAAPGTSAARAGAPLDRAAPPPRWNETETVPLAAVVDDPEEAVGAYAAGIRCVKIKLGADDRLERVVAIARAAPGATLRIDANRSWPRAEVAARLAALAELPIEYVEEPCRDAHLLLDAALPCPLALDESLTTLSHDELVAALRSPQLAAVILKPTLLGGLSVARELAHLARSFGVAAVASHALEGPIGTAACAELARALAAPPVDDGSRPPPRRAICPAVGLASHPALAGWEIEVEQLGADHIHAAAAAGLGLDFDLAAIVRSCRTKVDDDEVHPA